MLGIETKRLALVGCMFALLGGACGDSTSAEEPADGGGTGGEDETCGPDSKNTKGTAATASVSGTVKAPADFKGKLVDVYVAVMPEFNPTEACAGSPNAPVPVATYLARCVDLGMGEYAYKVDGVPVGNEYTVVPFADVNSNVDASDPKKAGPDTCDLISLGVKFKAKTAGEEVKVSSIEFGPATFLMAICMLPKCME